MKNKLIKVLLCSTLAIGVVRCTKELNTVPTQSIDVNRALKNSNDVKAALIGAYSDFGNVNFYGGRVFLEADLLANTGEMNWSGTYPGLTQINNKSIPKDNSFVTNIWLAGYRAINDVNNVLDSVRLVNATDTARVSGEAKFIRGASYFELVKRFAKAWNDGDPATNLGVPIILTPTNIITEQSNVKRNTVAEVYQQVIKDLQEAEAELPKSNGMYATKAAAEAILARVYLQKGDYTNAAVAANNAINNSGAILEDNFESTFGVANSKEDIFAIQVTSTSGTQGFNEFYSSAQRGDIQITDAFLKSFETGDKRKDFFYIDNGSTYTSKFEQLYGNVHTIRVAEMYLIRAEANFRMNTKIGDTPVDDINRIRKRAGLPTYTTAQLTLSKILKERRAELAFEGFALDDIKRTKGSVGNLPWNSPKLIFPIPNREIVVNPNLVQNEGY